MNIISRYQQALADNEIHPNPSQKEAVILLDRCLNDHIHHQHSSTKQGVYLWGQVGRGKTWLMDMFYANLPHDKKERWHFQELMRFVHQEMHRLQGHANPLHEIAAQLTQHIEVLCLDELLVEDVADAMILSTFFQALLTRGLLLIITGNLAPDELYAKGWQRERFLPAIALLKQQLYVIHIHHDEDYRRQETVVNPTYFYPDNIVAEQQMMELFQQYAHPPIYMDTTIEVNAHILFVHQVSSHALWCEFDALCGKPHSAEDYLSLAKRFPTLLISHTPLLDKYSENAARRFISLVDVYYDRRCRLIISAAVPMQELYQGLLLQHAFQRTLSRLWEMQTEKYAHSQ